MYVLDSWVFPDLSTYRVLGFTGAKNVFGCVYRDDVAERLVNGEFYSNPIQTGGGGGHYPAPQDEKN